MGASVRGGLDDKIAVLVEKLSIKIDETISSKADILIAKPVKKTDRIASLKKQLATKKKPSLTIDIQEHHINRAAVDPAAETEMLFFATELGFVVYAKQTDKSSQADILIQGEGFTEFATRKGDIVGVKARLEVKAIDQKTKRVLAVDRQTEIEIDLSELIAAKKALARASAKIAEHLLVKIVDSR